jgi:hypothetical protein
MCARPRCRAPANKSGRGKTNSMRSGVPPPAFKPIVQKHGSPPLRLGIRCIPFGAKGTRFLRAGELANLPRYRPTWRALPPPREKSIDWHLAIGTTP